MLVRTVSGINHTRGDALRQELGRSRRAMAEDNDIRVIGLQNAGRILESFAFCQARGRGSDVDDVGAEALGRELERGARSCARLDEQIDQGFSLKSGDFLDFARSDL